jgi:hypothetical protein
MTVVQVARRQTVVAVSSNSSSSGSSEKWQIITGTTDLVAGAYAVDALSLVTLKLPTVAVLSQHIKVYGLGNGGWRIAQSDGQRIRVGNKQTTLGVSGNILSVEQGDYLELVYLNGWNCTEIIGNLQIN